jgi:hypothetical protein
MAKKKQEVLKIKDEQLGTIQEFIKKAQNLQLEIGSLEFKKQDLLTQLEDVDNSLIAFQKVVNEEYGDIKLNISDGTYVKNE